MELKLVLLAIVIVGASAQMEENAFGRCSTKRFAGYSERCTRKFVLSFRKNPKVDCNEQFDRSVKCVKRWLRFCLKGLMPEKLFQQTLEGASSGESVDNMRELYCGTKDIALPMPDVSDSDCDKEFLPTLRMYMKKFFKMFRHKRSDPRLCNEYKLMQRNMKKLIKTHCKNKDLKQVSWAFEDKFNPFCPLKKKF